MPVDPSTVDHEIRTPVDGFTKAVRDKNIDARCRPTSSDNADRSGWPGHCSCASCAITAIAARNDDGQHSSRARCGSA